MKKSLLCFILLSFEFMSNAVFACPAGIDACVTAERPAAGGGSAIGAGGSSGNQTGAAGQVAGEQEGLKKAEEAKDAYCAKNPNTAFCLARAKKGEGKSQCKAKNIAGRKLCMDEARQEYASHSNDCLLYGANATFYGGVAATGVAVVPALVVGGSFATGAIKCQNRADSDRDTHIQNCQDSYDEFDATVCDLM